MQLLPMASSPDGLISARYAVITKTPGWRCGGGGGGGGVDIPRPGKAESTNSGATRSMPFLERERTNPAGLATVAREKQWTGAVISWGTFLVHGPARLSAPQ